MALKNASYNTVNLKKKLVRMTDAALWSLMSVIVNATLILLVGILVSTDQETKTQLIM
jgi:hypothetical protein